MSDDLDDLAAWSARREQAKAQMAEWVADCWDAYALSVAEGFDKPQAMDLAIEVLAIRVRHAIGDTEE